MKEENLEKESYDNLSDEEFLKRYDSHNKSEKRSNRYDKKKEGNSGIIFWIFLAIVFLISYFLFSKYMFPPKI